MNRGETGLYVVMGVTGAGKSHVGAAFAHAAGLPFVDGDDLHTAANRQRMAAGIALTDEDRAEWLKLIAGRLAEAAGRGSGLVAACSALKAKYRATLRASAPTVRFIYLKGTREVIAPRMAQRTGHFMPATLLDSQFEALEEPTPDESPWVVDVREPPSAIVSALVQRVANEHRAHRTPWGGPP